MTDQSQHPVRKKCVIVVLGMHRSGTSAITRGLQALGADLGPELMAGIKGDNEKGFWEDLGCYRINERILERLDSAWDALGEVPEHALTGEELAKEYDDAVALLRDRLANTDVFAFKDPRTVNLLPFWQKVFAELDLDDRYLITLRNPRSVADSLARRNEFAREKSFCLWMKHSCNALLYGTARPFVVVDYDRFMESPARELSRMAEPLGLAAPDLESAEYQEYVSEFLSTDLRHSKYAEALGDGDVVPPFVADLYGVLLDVASGCTKSKTGKTLNERCQQLRERFTQYAPVMGYVDRLERAEIAGLRESDRLRRELNTEIQAKAQLEAKTSELRKEVEELDVRRKHLYSRLYFFDRSGLGRIFALVEWVYRLLRLRPSSKSFYGQIIEDSREFIASDVTSALEFADVEPGRLRMIARILRYFIRHPYSSLRLVSVYRIKKLLQTVFLADSSTARAWVSARFPAGYSASRKPEIFPPETMPEQMELTFPQIGNPEVSIVIPVYNQYQTTLSCLKAVLEHTGEVNYEVIVADDCSTDITSSIENRIHNIRVVRGEENFGFLGNCNNAVAHARGKYMVLLNNDTNVQKGWLSALVSTMKADSKAGIVGPKLLFENGVLQEAGGIVWNDASGWNYGRGQSPDQPEFNYVRETDYISGACILFEKQVWDELGGFDERFKPAYYEDTDLAFQMRARGLKVLFQPESEVVHFEGVSNGTDVGSGIKKHQAINQEVFREKWQDVLEKEHFPNAQNVFQARERSAAKRTVVFVDHYVPFYDKDAGSRSTYLYVKSMVDAGLNVKFVPANFFPHQPYTRSLQQLGVEVLLGEKYARSWKTWFSDNAQYIDVIYLHRPHITEDFVDHMTTLKPKPKLIYFGHDLHYLRTAREAELKGDKAVISDAEDWKKRELAIFKKVDKVYYPSEVEVAEVKRVSPATDVSAIPLYLLNTPDLSRYHHQDRHGLLFVGGFGHPPNSDGVHWFLSEVMPSLVKEIPDICLHVVGSSVPDSIKDLANDHVKIYGFLSDEDLTELYQQVRVCVVPLRFGAGVKGKILEALQAGVPISTTSIGAEGLPDAAEVMAIADEPREMTRQLLTLYNEPEECARFLSKYQEYIEQNFGQAKVQEVITADFLN
ncbi:glycosyltransferase [Marinobacter sp. M216]|uniref:Glycosyltransferase n=1 Tax=Marinobacter albus TaxID=3030833 RepID=A0ABT7HA63_9GAMM|nr:MULTISPECIES: glycosyltransferase [unclassified Marinobacter]MBW7470474.1 glycosyltransferase [Marinobacter sp. F4218]MDK9557258.1 glycosyltransferase [Marinobacter sp. M216]